MADQNMLIYLFTPKPNPLATGENGEIRLQILRGGTEKRNVREIMVTAPCGRDAESVFQSVSGAGIRAEEPERWECGREAMHEGEAAASPAYFHIRAQNPEGDPMDAPSVFLLTGKAAETAGNALVSIFTVFADGTQENSSAYISKGDGELYLENFLASGKDKPEAPMAVFGRREPFRLSWNSNGDFFRLYASGEAKPLAETTDTVFAVEGGLEEDTTFILQATKPSASSLCLYRTLAVHIRDQSLEKLEIRQGFRAEGAVQELLGEPSPMALQKAGEYFDWMFAPETDGYIVGSLEFGQGVEGNGSLTVRECNADKAKCYEASDMAFQGKILRPDGDSWDIGKKASVCLPVRKEVIAAVSLRIFSISQAENYHVEMHFVPFGTGMAKEV